jgi:putative membrane protein
MISKGTLSLTALAAGVALGAAAQTRTTAPDAQNRSIVTAEAPRAAVNNKSAEDVEFLVEAMRTGLAEAKLGELAAERGSDPRVRELGMRAQRDHSQQVAEIARLLEPLNVTIPEEPSAEAQLRHAALARLSGEEFDAAFLETIIESHTEAIEQYGAQTHANPDQTLEDFANKNLTMLREHLAAAEALR